MRVRVSLFIQRCLYFFINLLPSILWRCIIEVSCVYRYCKSLHAVCELFVSYVDKGNAERQGDCRSDSFTERMTSKCWASRKCLNPRTEIQLDWKTIPNCGELDLTSWAARCKVALNGQVEGRCCINPKAANEWRRKRRAWPSTKSIFTPGNLQVNRPKSVPSSQELE